MTLQQAIEEFLSELLRKGYSRKTAAAYRFEFGKFLSFLGEYLNLPQNELLLANFTAESIRSWIDSCLFSGAIQTKTLARKVAAIKSFSRSLYINEWLPFNVADKISIPKVPKTLPQALSQEQIRLLGETLDHSDKNFLRDKVILALLYSGGLRVNELATLKIGQINHDLNLIRVFGKGAKERLIPMAWIARNSILQYIEFREKALGLQGAPEEYLLMKSKSKRMTVRMIQYAVEKIGKQSGILLKIHPHLLRHSIATHLIENGASVESVRQTLGHTDLATTSIYLSVSQKFLKQEHKQYNPADSLLK